MAILFYRQFAKHFERGLLHEKRGETSSFDHELLNPCLVSIDYAGGLKDLVVSVCSVKEVEVLGLTLGVLVVVNDFLKFLKDAAK